MRTLRFGLIFALLALLLTMVGLASAQDDDRGRVYILEEGEVLEDVFTENITGKLYAFNGSEGDEVTITVEGISDDMDPYAVLMGERGEVIGGNDDADGLDTLIEAELPQDGSYFLFVSRAAPLDEILEEDLEFRLEVEGFREPKNLEDPESVTRYTNDVTGGVSGEAEITLDEPVFYFVFDGQEGDVVNISVDTDNFDAALHLFDPEGLRITASDDTNGTTNPAIVAYELPADGQYTFFVTTLYFFDLEGQGENKVGTFELNFSSK